MGENVSFDLVRRACIFVLVVSWNSLALGEEGVTGTSVRLGQPVALTGQSASRGKDLRDGAQQLFDEVNATGGVYGRKIEVVTMDHRFEPKMAVELGTKMIEESGIFAFFQIQGTPSVRALLPLIAKKNIPAITPVANGESLRRPPIPGVFFLQSGFVDETEVMVDFLVGNQKIKDISAFIQDDSLGQEGVAALQAALIKKDVKLKSVMTYKRNETGLADADVKKIIDAKPGAVVTFGAPGQVTKLIALMQEKGATPVYIVSSGALSPELLEKTSNAKAKIYITPTLPYITKIKSKIVEQFEKSCQKKGVENSFSRFQGYFNAAFFVEALKRNGKELTRKSLISTIENTGKFDIGGIEVKFSPSSHVGIRQPPLLRISSGKLEALAD